MTSLSGIYERLNAERNREVLGDQMRLVPLTRDDLTALCLCLIRDLERKAKKKGTGEHDGR